MLHKVFSGRQITINQRKPITGAVTNRYLQLDFTVSALFDSNKLAVGGLGWLEPGLWQKRLNQFPSLALCWLWLCAPSSGENGDVLCLLSFQTLITMWAVLALRQPRPASIITITSTSYICLLPRLAASFTWRQLVNSFEETSDANSDYLHKEEYYIIRKMRSFIKIHHRTNIYLSNVNVEHKKSMRQRHMSTIACDPVAVPAVWPEHHQHQTRRYANLSPATALLPVLKGPIQPFLSSGYFKTDRY